MGISHQSPYFNNYAGVLGIFKSEVGGVASRPVHLCWLHHLSLPPPPPTSGDVIGGGRRNEEVAAAVVV
jgi:hypothetical protein